MTNIPETNRKYDLKRPPGHKVAIPRWTLKFPDGVTHTYTLYVGVQCRSAAAEGSAKKVEQRIQTLLESDADGKPEALDTFRVTEGLDIPDTRVWVTYWTARAPFEAAIKAIDLKQIWRSIPDDKNREAIGLWIEHFATPLERLETNYAALHHRPGLAQIKGTEQPSHELTGYWGAGRDRLAASAEDRFEPATTNGEVNGSETKEGKVPKGIGEYVSGTNEDNVCHIRSGQYWETCGEKEREAYETKLEPVLMEGMRYLWTNAAETGTLGLRFLQNLSPPSPSSPAVPIKETSGAGFHRNWADLEHWASRHPSHLDIFSGAMRHNERFGKDKRFMTWHEVSILKQGEARWGYVNCALETGVMRWVGGLGVEGL